MVLSLAGTSINPRLLSTRLISLGAIITLMLTLYTYSSYSSFSFELPAFLTGRIRASCSPQAWDNGSWIEKPAASNFTPMTKPEDALLYSGFSGCASSREYFWHLASDTPGQWDRFPGVSSWVWSPNESCKPRSLIPEEMVRDLVEQGGWLLLGDSITEGQFFSLSCILYPHVRATPDYIANPYFDRAWPQNLYLSPNSSLIPHLRFPTNFSIENTPLVTFRRVDLLLDKSELIDLHRAVYNPPANFSLFSEEGFWSLSPQYYMPLFTAPLPEANYATLVASTGGHWTTTLMSGFRKEEAEEDELDGFGIYDVMEFFKIAMKKWATDVQEALYEDHNNNSNRGKRRPRVAVVRAYLPGHEDCHDWREPWTEDLGFKWNWYNWSWIKDFNHIFESVLSSLQFPDIHYLPIDTPARLRPDAHATGDCLHIMTGAGVMEGWSHYIWHFVTRELPGRMR